MSIRKDFKELFKEFSAIIAGFKLGVILISYIGIGSIAKWFVEHWYPFTRKIWDWLAISLNIPEFSIVVKDSLTALVFFLPLGITAVYQIFKPPLDLPSRTYKLLAGVFGVAAFYLVVKNVLDVLFEVVTINPSSASSMTMLLSITSAMLGFSYGLYVLVTTRSAKAKALDVHADEAEISKLLGRGTFSYKLEYTLTELNKKSSVPIFIVMFTIMIGIFLGLRSYFLITLALDPVPKSAVFVALVLLTVTIICIILATLYAPRKLLLATGAAIAFVLAAFLYEGLLKLITFVETTNSVASIASSVIILGRAV